MHFTAVTTELEHVRCAAIALCAFAFVAATPEPVLAASCSFEPQGEGRVAAVIDAPAIFAQQRFDAGAVDWG